MSCKQCNAPPASAIEQRTNLCISCLETTVAAYDQVVRLCDEAQTKLEDVKTQLETQTNKVSMFERLMKAEREGNIASENGLPEDQNPYVPDKDEFVMWLAGWAGVDTRRRGLQAHAVMSWSVGALTAISELARGYDQQELAAKLEVVLSKFKTFVEE